MIDSLLEEITSLSEDGASKEQENEKNSYVQNGAEYPLLKSLPIVRTIVNRKIVSSLQSDASDLIQVISLRLLDWREKYREKSDKMSSEEWDSFAARTTYNEINRYFSNQKGAFNVPIEEAIPVAVQSSAEGNTKVEFSSLANLIWQNICCLSLRQRRALLLHSYTLIFCLRKSGIGLEELLDSLELSRSDWDNIKNDLPLSDVKIAELLKESGKKGSLESVTKSIKKGRHEARKKLRRLMNQ